MAWIPRGGIEFLSSGAWLRQQIQISQILATLSKIRSMTFANTGLEKIFNGCLRRESFPAVKLQRLTVGMIMTAVGNQVMPLGYKTA
jgi:hypothetical protein